MLILYPVLLIAQNDDSLHITKTGLQKWQFSFASSIYLTTFSINKPYNINLLEDYETQIINGVNIFFKGEKSVSSNFEYDFLFRVNKHFTNSFFAGIEAGPCLRYMIRNGSEEADGMDLKLGIETGYLIDKNIYIIIKMSGILFAKWDNYSSFGLGFKYCF